MKQEQVNACVWSKAGCTTSLNAVSYAAFQDSSTLTQRIHVFLMWKIQTSAKWRSDMMPIKSRWADTFQSFISHRAVATAARPPSSTPLTCHGNSSASGTHTDYDITLSLNAIDRNSFPPFTFQVATQTRTSYASTKFPRLLHSPRSDLDDAVAWTHWKCLVSEVSWW